MTEGLDTTPGTDTRDEAYVRAHERAEALQGYYIHLLIYIVVNAGLFLINYLTTSGDGGWWFQWTLLGWGIGLAVHTIVVAAPVFSNDWVERKTKRLQQK
jgi:hypothetical protein